MSKVYGWVWPNTDNYLLIGDNVDDNEAKKIQEEWMSKSNNHDAVIVTADEK